MNRIAVLQHEVVAIAGIAQHAREIDADAPHPPFVPVEDDAVGVGRPRQAARTQHHVAEPILLVGECVRPRKAHLARHGHATRAIPLRLRENEHVVKRREQHLRRRSGTRHARLPHAAPLLAHEQVRGVERHPLRLGKPPAFTRVRQPRDLRFPQVCALVEPAGEHHEVAHRHALAVRHATRPAHGASDRHPLGATELADRKDANLVVIPEHEVVREATRAVGECRSQLNARRVRPAKTRHQHLPEIRIRLDAA